MTSGTPRPDRRTRSVQAAWRRTDARDRAVLVGGGVVAAVLALLAVLDPATVPVAVVASLAYVVIAARCLGAVQREQRRRDDLVQQEVTRGIGELESWLATRRHA